jgi:murein endopeptidase
MGPGMSRARRLFHSALLGGALAAALGSNAVAKTSTAQGRKLAPEAPAGAVKPAKKVRVEALGSISVGRPDAGLLINGVRLPASPDWVVTAPTHAYGTEESVEQLAHCIHKVRASFPGSPAVMLGSLSKREGGVAPPHKSHRSGRDADVYFFRKPGARWYDAATEDDLDLPRTWALLRCFVSETDVDFVLIERKVQRWLEDYALDKGEPRDWVESLFHDGPGEHRAAVRHAPGHVAHMHVRFVSAKSRQRALTYYDRLVAEGRIKGALAAIKHKVKPGETLGGVAKKYRTSVAQLQKLNKLKSTSIRAGQELDVSRGVPLKGVKDPIRIPPRRVPPGPVILSSITSSNDTLRAEADAQRSELWQATAPF